MSEPLLEEVVDSFRWELDAALARVCELEAENARLAEDAKAWIEHCGREHDRAEAAEHDKANLLKNLSSEQKTKRDAVDGWQRACSERDAAEAELRKLAADLGEPDDPFAAWEALAAIKAKAEAAETKLAAALEALEFYASPEVYKAHPHGPAFDRRDLSHAARALLAGQQEERPAL